MVRLKFLILLTVVMAIHSSVIHSDAIGGEPQANIPMSFVAGDDPQDGGPDYDFRIGQLEIRNDEFVIFLNDAVANFDNERGQFIFVDMVTGDVYINDMQTGAVGTEPPEPGVLMFSPDTTAQIEWFENEFRVASAETEYDAHPVAGVTWFGAVKFCNWLTIDAGLPPGERAYSESTGSNLAGWRPISISAEDWAVRGLNGAEREALTQVRGFRLPMGGDSDAGPYNEWLKASSARVDGEQIVFDSSFGFGRNMIDGSDANYRCSGDPFEDVECLVATSSPAGYFDGINLLADGTATRDTANAYGLYDISGNVWEWLQDQTFPQINRNVRGGSFSSSSSFLALQVPATRDAATEGEATGFRVLQTIVARLDVAPDEAHVTTGIWGGPFDGDGATATFSVTNLTSAPIPVEVSVDVDWIELGESPDVIPGSASVDVTASVATDCAIEWAPGNHTGRIAFLNLETNHAVEREFSVTISEPLAWQPPDGIDISVLAGNGPRSFDFTVENASASDVDFSVRVETDDGTSGVAWVSINGTGEVIGATVPGMDTAVVNVEIIPAELSPGSYSAELHLIDDCTDQSETRAVQVEVLAPFSINPLDDGLFSGGVAGPFFPEEVIYELENLTESAFAWNLSIEAVGDEPAEPWLTISPEMGSLPANGTVDVNMLLTTDAYTLPAGQYENVVTFDTEHYSKSRIVRLVISEFDLYPEEGVTFAGPRQGPFNPGSFPFTITSSDLKTMEWTAQLVESCDADSLVPVEWADVSPALGVIKNPLGTANITVELSDAAASLVAGIYQAQLCVASIDPNDPDAQEQTVRTRDIVLEVALSAFSIPMVRIPADVVRAGGPEYPFRVSRTEVTNADFVRFLNDAELDQGQSQRSSNMVMDAVTGGVTLPSGVAMCLTSSLSTDSRIAYDPSGTLGARYSALDEYQQHPVTHVSWYGAAKYCNWLTAVQGMSGQLIYLEGDDAEQWVPFTTDHQTLVSRFGFRLPSDGGADGVTEDNEWNKFADAVLDEVGDHHFDAAYGFGRSVLEPADANYNGNGDPYESSTTPAAFFDGSTYNFGGDGSVGNGVEFETAPTANAFGLYDLTGNVAEWTHELSGGTAFTRGGHFENGHSSSRLTNIERAPFVPGLTARTIGFRVVQALPESNPVLSVEEATGRVRVQGFYGGPFDVVGAPADNQEIRLLITNESEFTIDQLAFTLTPGAGPLRFVQNPPQQLPATSTVEVVLDANGAQDAIGVSPPPPGNFSFVSGDNSPNFLPGYDFWIGREEVSNASFVTFLNDVFTELHEDAASIDSAYMALDVSSGDIYLAPGETGELVDGIPDPGVPVFGTALSRIEYSEDGYLVAEGFDNHPVTGVSWFGAAKYCNWLSRAQGVPVSLLAMYEGPATDPDSWRPVTAPANEWDALFGIGSRDDLISETHGYRLPMQGNGDGFYPFAEWYKAAAWENDDWVLHMYGHGSEEILPIDANSWSNGDTEEDGTTPVGFFNGDNTMYRLPSICPDPTPAVKTAASRNAYGIVDTTGNVWEWTLEPGGGGGERVVAGGGWRDAIESFDLTTRGRRDVAAGTTADDVGFRMVRGAGYVASLEVEDRVYNESTTHSFILDVREPLEILPVGGFSEDGDYGDDFSGIAVDYDVENRSGTAISLGIAQDLGWVDVGFDGDPASSRSLEPGNQLTATVMTNEQANELVPGEHQATIIFSNEQTGHSELRRVVLAVGEATSLLAAFGGVGPYVFSAIPGGDFVILDDESNEQDELSFTLASLVSGDLEFELIPDVPWLDVNAESEGSGVLSDGASVTFGVLTSEEAASLPVGEHSGQVELRLSDSANGNSWSRFIPFSLNVDEPLAIESACGPCDCGSWEVGPEGDTSALCEQVFNLRNLFDTDGPVIEVSISSGEDWLTISENFVELLPSAVEVFPVVVSPNEQTGLLHDGDYSAVITFENLVSGTSICRPLELTVTETISTHPFSSYTARGLVGQPADPPFVSYTLSNVTSDDGDVEWVACVDQNWLMLSGGSSVCTDVPVACASGSAVCGTLSGEDTEVIVIAVDPSATAGLGAGNHTGTLHVVDNTNEVSVARAIDLTLIEPVLSISDLVEVGADVEQPSGPDYDFSLGQFPVTSAQFVAFLNDAMQHPEDGSGAYLFFETSTGDVFLNDAALGAVGPDADAGLVRMFSISESDQVQFVDGSYEVVSSQDGYSRHPVTGVNWFGAVKFCNWLTLDQGLFPEDRCYHEGPSADPDAWRPIVIGKGVWASRDLNDAERLSLLSACRGFRLPMDNGSTNPDFLVDAADPHNEWYKAAAWDPTANTNRLYGTGADAIDGAAANFRCSGDPFEDPNDCESGGTTPVGFYDGLSLLSDGTPTIDTLNAFGLYDMSGNVFQWVQDRLNTAPGGNTIRAIRGGAFLTDETQLRNTVRSWGLATMTSSFVGFRVLRIVPGGSGDFDGDNDIDIIDHVAMQACMEGPQAAIEIPGCTAFDFAGADDDVDLKDFASFQNEFSGGQ